MIRPTRIVGALAAILATAPAAAERWTLARTTYFEVLCESGELAAVELARELERFRFALAANTDLVPRDLELQRMVVFRNGGSMRRYVFRGASRDALPSGLTADRHPERPAVGLDGSDLAFALRFARHEFVHACLAAHPSLPHWLGEGLAEYFSDTATDEGSVRFGARTRGGTWLLPVRETMPIARLLSYTSYPDDSADLARFYYTALAWIRYLVHGAGGGLEGLDGLVARIASGEDSAGAIAEVYGKPLGELEAGFRTWHEEWPEWTPIRREQRLSSAVTGVSVEVPTRGERDIRIAELGIHGERGSRKRAETVLRKALEDDPSNPLAVGLLVDVLVADERVSEALEVCRAASAAGPISDSIRWSCAAARVEQPCAGGPAELRDRLAEAAAFAAPLEGPRHRPLLDRLAAMRAAVDPDLPVPSSASADTRLLVLVVRARTDEIEALLAEAAKIEARESDREWVREVGRCVAKALRAPPSPRLSEAERVERVAEAIGKTPTPEKVPSAPRN